MYLAKRAVGPLSEYSAQRKRRTRESSYPRIHAWSGRGGGVGLRRQTRRLKENPGARALNHYEMEISNGCDMGENGEFVF